MSSTPRSAAGPCRPTAARWCWFPTPTVGEGLTKRLLQLRSLASLRSFERLRVTVPALQQTLDRVLRARRFDVVNLEFPYLGHYDLRHAPPGQKAAAVWS